MAKPLAFAVGVPIGIPVGALVAAFYEICDKNDPAAYGVVFGFVSAMVAGGAYGVVGDDWGVQTGKRFEEADTDCEVQMGSLQAHCRRLGSGMGCR